MCQRRCSRKDAVCSDHYWKLPPRLRHALTNTPRRSDEWLALLAEIRAYFANKEEPAQQ